ncbi:hypothetical protein [Martelella mediterranea]|uniref:Uncharacterized protein n=1 Tax=Martelella mediterranea TaxID=293089 RepID=A0A4R3NJY6_9HYPH|nr:hypothetical protein [Martelella mediterranea]TCT34630.1 hypothetical protein EDC90_103324 [Martelella mediterranea]
MTIPTNAGELRRLIGAVEAQKAGIPSIEIDNYELSSQAHRLAGMAALAHLVSAEGAKVNDGTERTIFSLAGIKASSTSGTPAVLSNWIAAAKLKLKMENRNV